MWDSTIAALIDLRDDTTILTIDFPGFGDSPVQEHWTMWDMARQICEIVKKCTSDKVILAGLSMGGYAALAFYREYPALVRGLVLSNTKAEADTEEAKANREVFALDALKRGSDAAIERMYSGFVTKDTDPEIAIDIRKWMTDAKPEAIAAALRAMASREDSTSLLRLISIPSLVISGSEDKTIPSTIVREMAQHLQDAAYVEMESTAHLTAVERPNEWAEALSSFLDRL